MKTRADFALAVCEGIPDETLEACAPTHFISRLCVTEQALEDLLVALDRGGDCTEERRAAREALTRSKGGL